MATIGIDLTPIQGPHRMRGVGSVVINVLRHTSEQDKALHTFVFYAYVEGRDEALELIDAKSFSNHEVRDVAPAPPLPPSIKTPRGIAHIPQRIKSMWLDRKYGTKRITQLDDLDSFLQFEQDVLPPPTDRIKSTVIAYDLIPYVLESDYLWSYKTARKSHNYSRRGALKAQAKRSIYLSTIRAAMQRAHRVIAISEHTKQDFVKYAGVPSGKISVCYLGISDLKLVKHKKPSSIERYVGTSWGDVKVKTKLPDTPFLLFVGGADPRRKLADLIHAFNLLRAQGHKIHLVLTGDTMLGPNSLPNEEARLALLSSSYLEDIYLLGFVTDATREWLYQNALAFVYPSRYEGFGLPILEALQYETAVITYDNSSITEIAGSHVMFASDHISIAQQATPLLSSSGDIGSKLSIDKFDINRFNWALTAEKIISQLEV